MIKTRIEDGEGKGNHLRIDDEGSANVVVHPHPPRNESGVLLPLREYMTLNNDGTTIDMRVNGSVEEKIFQIRANQNGNDKDRYIACINLVIADAGAVLNKFGNLPELTNGVEIRWVTDEYGTVVIADGLVSNWEFIRLSGGKPSYGDGAGAFRSSNVAGTSEGYLIQLDFDEIFGIQWGFRLRHGTNDRLEVVIKDDITNIDKMDAICYGSQF